MEKLKYALFMGCTPYGATPELKMAMDVVPEKLGIELIELTEASCCGASHLQDFDEFLSIVINARNLCYAEKLGLDLITICNTCQLNLSTTNNRLKKDKELRERVNKRLQEVGLEFKGTIEVKHFLYALIDDFGLEKLKELVTHPIYMKIAPFYGCHNIRPSKSEQNENPYAPTSLEKLVDVLGGVPTDYKEKTRCCGFHVELQNPKEAHIMGGNAMLGAKDSGADAIVTPCPLCHLSFDAQQKSAEKLVGREIDMPVFHTPQLIGLALGIDKESLGLKKHVVKIRL